MFKGKFPMAFRYSLRARLIVFVLVIIVFLSTVQALVSYFSMSGVLSQDVADEFNLIADYEASRIDEQFIHIEDGVDNISAIIKNQVTDTDVIKQKKTRNKLTKSLGIVLNSIACDIDGVVADYVRWAPELAGNGKEGFFTSIENGEAVRVNPTDINAYDPDDIEHVGWYTIPTQAAHAIWMDPYHNDNLNIFMISYVVPVYVDGTLVCVTGMDINFKTLITAVDGLDLPGSAHAFLKNSDGSLHYHTDFLFDKDVHGDDDIEWTQNSELISQDDTADKIVGYTFQGVDEIMSFTTLKNGMKIVIYDTYDAVYSQRNMIVWMIIFVAVLFIVIFTVLILKVTKSMQSLAYTDEMTKVKNHTAYNAVVRSLDDQIRDGIAQFAVLMCDIDHLKLTNDAHGHAAGDEIIKKAATMICASFPLSTVFRVGGDEFVVILEGYEYANRDQLCSYLEATLTREAKSKKQRSRRTELSWGIACYTKGSDANYESVYERADRAMYEHKRRKHTDKT